MQYCLDCVYVGIVTLVAAWLGKYAGRKEKLKLWYTHTLMEVSESDTILFFVEVFCWTFTGERQSSTIRVKYLRALLSQDIGFYDTDSTTGEIVVGISSDTVLVQDAIGEKVSISHSFIVSPT